MAHSIMSLFATFGITFRMNDIKQLTLILAVSSVIMLSTTCVIIVLNVVMLSDTQHNDTHSIMSLFATFSMTLRMNDIKQLTLILAESSVFMLSTTCFTVVLNVVMLIDTQHNDTQHYEFICDIQHDTQNE
jgi:hypothetical protein